MSPSVRIRYTRFPDLNFGSDTQLPASAQYSVSLPSAGEGCTRENIIQSWAELLRAFTGDNSPVFDLENSPIRFDLDEARLDPVEVEEHGQAQQNITGILFTKDCTSDSSKWILSLQMDLERRQGILFSTLKVKPDYVRQISLHFRHAFHKVLYKSGKKSIAFDLEESELSILNSEPDILDGPKLFHHLLEDSREGSANAIECILEDGSTEKLSYADLHRRSDELATRLVSALKASKGGLTGRVIPILLPQCPNLYVSQLAVLKAGAAFCPLNLDSPQERLRFILQDVGAEVVISAGVLISKFDDIKEQISVIDPTNSSDDRTGVVSLENITEPDWSEAAYIMYTSGSTGLPKGVPVSHRAVVQSLLAHRTFVPPFKRFLQFAAPTFDVSVFEIFFPLIQGATLVGCDRSQMLSDLPGTMNALQVDAAELTPTVAGQLLRSRDAVPTLGLLLTIGEMLTTAVVEEFGHSDSRDGILYGMYGPTEAAIHCTVASKISASSKVGNIGVPFETVSAFVASIDSVDSINVLPVGHVGELVVGGPQVANGYLNRPEQTSAAFIETEKYGLVYRTGDKARLLPNGELECLGRISSGQVKLRGQRIELGEIEQVVCKTAGIRSSMASVIGGILIVFCIVDHDDVSIDEVRTICQSWLPRFMVPGDFVLMKTPPRLPSGKIDRKQLEADYQAQRNEVNGITQGSKHGETEKLIAESVRNLLGIELADSSSLAAAGLDSLRAIRLSSLLRSRGLRISVSQILEFDSLEGLFSHCAITKDISAQHNPDITATQQATGQKAALQALLPEPSFAAYEEIFLCSPIQLAMLAETERQPSAYFNWIEIETGSDVEASDFIKAFQEVAKHNYLLRSGFIPVTDSKVSYVQIVWPAIENHCFVQLDHFEYDHGKLEGLDILHPLKVQLISSQGKMRLLIHAHHAIYDGWSWDLLMMDLETALNGDSLVERPSYTRFTDYHSNLKDTATEKQSLLFWLEQLEGANPATFPTLQARCDLPPTRESFSQPLKICVSELDQAARELQVSRQTIFQAAFAFLLQLYTDNSDVIFGSVSSGRTIPVPGIEEIIGPCIATLPMRLNLAACRTVRDLLSSIHKLNRDFLLHGWIPLRDIKRASRLEGGKPLFDTLIVWQETSNTGQIRQGGKLIHVQSEDSLEFPLMVELEPCQANIRAKVTYKGSLIPEDHVQCLINQIDCVASLFMKNWELPLSDVNAKLETSLLSIENANYERQVNAHPLVHGVESTAKLFPERPAIQFVHEYDSQYGVLRQEILSYAQLNSKANQLARHLCSLGATSGDNIMIFMEKSVDLYVAIIAVVKTGAGYLPLTAQTPSARVVEIAKEANVKLCLTTSALSGCFEDMSKIQTIELDRVKIGHLPQLNLDLPRKKDSVAYTIFTSGTTGKPKGLSVLHGNLESHLSVLEALYPCPDASKLLQGCSHAFDVSVFEIFFTWHRSMTLCAANADTLFPHLEGIVNATGVTHLSFTSTVASLLHPDNVPNVKFLVTAGEPMAAKVVNEWGGRGLRNGYGPSETTNICSMFPTTPSYFANNVGPPFKNTSILVTTGDESLTILPRGAIGEICCGGEQVCGGYVNLPERTASQFIEHPEFGRIYRSGDYGRLLMDGSIVCLGRRDDQIKLRGQRIELGEINSNLLRNPGVQDCNTILWTDAKQRQQLITFWISSQRERDDESNGVSSLFSYLRSRLPAYMIPNALVPVTNLPQTTQGKVDKRRLITYYQSLDQAVLQSYTQNSDDAADESEHAFTEIENVVADAVSQAADLARDEIKRNTSLFQLGIDSITALSLSRLLAGQGFRNVTVSTILRNSSVGRLSDAIAELEKDLNYSHPTNKDSLDVFSQSFLVFTRKEFEEQGKSVQDILPCTSLQEAMLSKSSDSRETAYLNRLVLKITGDVSRIKSAFDQLIRRHDILRTCFVQTDNAKYAFAQVVLRGGTLAWIESEYSDSRFEAAVKGEDDEREEERDSLIPSFRLRLIRKSNSEDRILVVTVHHALHDAEAMSQLLFEAECIYQYEDLPASVPFRNYVEKALSLDTNRADTFWKSQLQGFLPVPIGRKSAAQPNAVARYHSEHIQIGQALDSVNAECKRLSITLLNLCQAAWSRLLAAYTGKGDVCFGNVFSGRTIQLEGAERIIGPCFTTLPVRVKIDHNSITAKLIRNLQSCNAEILPFQLSSLRRIQQQNSTNGQRIFDTLLLLQNETRPLNEKIWSPMGETGDMDFPVILELAPESTNNSIRATLHYQDSYIPGSDAKVVLQNFDTVISQTLRYVSSRSLDLGQIDLPSFANEEARSDRIARVVSQFANENKIYPAEYKWTDDGQEFRQIFSDLSGVSLERITPFTTIFQLGLDSINAVQVANQIRRQGRRVTVGDILENPSIDMLCQFISTVQKTFASSGKGVFNFQSFHQSHLHHVCVSTGISPDMIERVRPCTAIQAGILAQFSHSKGAMYFNHMVFRLSDEVKIEKLRDAWNLVCARHEMLRTGFAHIDRGNEEFVMVTYDHNLTALPFEISAARHDTSQWRKAMSEDVLAKLHHPVWRVSIYTNESGNSMQFSALHAIFDAQSLNIIFDELADAYRNKVSSANVTIEETLNQIVTSNSTESSEPREFWSDLGKNFQITRFPDTNLRRVSSTSSRVISHSSSKSLIELDNACRKLGVTIQALGQVAWARLLSAYVGDQAVTFGTVLSGRGVLESSDSVVFPCISTVPVPYIVEGKTKDMLAKAMKISASLVKHQFTPLTKIYRWTGMDHGLFDTIFIYQKTTKQANNTALWELIDEDASADYAISLELIPSPDDGLEFRMTYSLDVVPLTQARLMLKQLDALLWDTATRPDADIASTSELDLELLSVTPAEENLIDSPVNLLHQFVEKSAREYPSKIALEFATAIDGELVKKKSWSYAELDAQSNRYAHLLINAGVMQGQLVGICFDKCPEASFAIIAILKAGCAYVAFDPSAPIARKQFIAKDSEAPIILCTAAREHELTAIPNVKILVLDTPDLLRDIPSTSPVLQRKISPQDTSYCLYTSGTTGTPKGCELTHENAVQAMLAFQRLFQPHWDADSKWLQFASFHFDVSVLEQFWSWSVGICVTSAPRDLLFEDLPGAIHALQITHIDLTPSLARLVRPDEVPNLCRGVFITGGEALKQEILDAWGEKGVIYNGYGPTEVTIGCTMYPRVPIDGKPSNIGPQFVNVGSYVFAPNSNMPVMRGAVGELCVSGALVGRGYLKRPELTEQRFQYLPEYGERVYRTGDLVRILTDGTFDFLGRIDDQVKLRGQRLEIGEINEVIRNGVKEVQEITTLVLKHPKQSKEQLVSFVSRVKTRKGTESPYFLHDHHDAELVGQIRQACHQSLPGYMIPTHIMPISSMPLSPNNKVDAKVLKQLFNDMSLEDMQKLNATEAVETDVDPENIKKIIEILAETTDISVLDITSWSNIFELGLDSISVISFSRKLKRAGFPTAQSSLVMSNPTIAGLARALCSARNDMDDLKVLQQASRQNIAAYKHRYLNYACKTLGAAFEDVEDMAPCTALQEGMIYRCLESEKALYFSTFEFRLSPNLDLSRLRRAWELVQATAEVLRISLVMTPEGYAQVLLHITPLPWTILDAPLEEDSIETKHVVGGSSSAERKDLNNLWGVVIRRGINETHMHLNLFHGLYDGNSLPLLLNEVAACYTTGRAKISHPSFFAALPAGPLMQHPAAQEFWTGHLRAADFRPLKTYSITKNQQPPVSATTIDDLGSLETIKRSLGVTDQALIHAAWLITLQETFKMIPVIGIVVSGRSIEYERAEEVLGPMFNTIPSSINPAGLRTWGDLVKACHTFNVSSLPFQHTPLKDIMRWCRDFTRQPLFESLFVYQKTNAIEGNGLQHGLWELIDSAAYPDYPLAFEAEQTVLGSLAVTLVGQPGAFAGDELDALLSRFESALMRLLQNPERSLAQHQVPSMMNGSPSMINGHSNGQANGPKLNNDTEFTWNATSVLLRDEIAELSGVEKKNVLADSSIFEIGLDSIDAIKLSSRMKRHGFMLSVSTIMKARTVRKISATMASSTSGNGDSRPSNEPSLFSTYKRQLWQSLRVDVISQQNIEDIFPVTPLQEVMIAEMVSTGYKNYFNIDFLELSSEADPVKLINAWNAVIELNPILRSSFTETTDPSIASTYAQIVHRKSQIDWSQVTTQTCDFERTCEQLVIEARKKASEGKPLSLALVTDGKKTRLILAIAHALYDGTSLDLLHQDVANQYEGTVHPRPPLEPVLEEIFAISSSQAASDFWRHILSGASPSVFPLSSTDKPEATYRCEIVSEISPNDIETFCRKQGITTQTLGLTCWSLVLASHVQMLDVVFGVVLSGRDFENAAETMFPTMNTVAVRSIIHGTPSAMLSYMQDMMTEIAQYQHFPLRRAKALSGVGGATLFNTLFIYQKRLSGTLTADKPLYQSIGGSSDIEQPLCIEMEIDHDNLVWRTACDSSLLDESQVQNLLAQIDTVLMSLIKNKDGQIVGMRDDSISILTLPPFKVQKSATNQGSLLPRKHEHSNGTDSEIWSETETTIREIISRVSSVPAKDIAKHSTIFELGLDSISAIKVSSLLKKQSLRLTVSDMLRAATIPRMARMANISSVNKAADIPSVLPIKGLEEGNEVKNLLSELGIDGSQVESILPTTAGQGYVLGMWQASNGHLFYPRFCYTLRNLTSREVLEKAWFRLLNETPILRTVIIPTGQRQSPYLQLVMAKMNSPVHWLHEKENGHCEDGPSLTHGLPSFVSLAAEMVDGETRVALKIHHALYDGVSLPSLISRLCEFCNGKTEPAKSDLKMASLLSLNHDTIAQNTCQEFWKNYLQDHTSYKAKDQEVTSSAIDDQTICRVEDYRQSFLTSTADIEFNARKAGLSFQTLFIAIFAKAYSSYLAAASTRNLVVGLYLANRSLDLEGIAESLLPTFNVVPLRIELLDPMSGNVKSVLEIAKAVQSDIQEISFQAHSTVSLIQIEEWSGVRIDCFLNFLRLPIGQSENLDGDQNTVTAFEIDAEAQEMDQMLDVDRNLLQFFSRKESKVTDVYLPLHSFDIEAAVRNNKLDVGIFATRNHLRRLARQDEEDGSAAVVENIFTDLKRQLESFREILA